MQQDYSRKDLGTPRPGEVWRHVKSSADYEILTLMRNEANGETLVEYLRLSDKEIFCRSLKGDGGFISIVELPDGTRTPRFILVDTQDLTSAELKP